MKKLVLILFAFFSASLLRGQVIINRDYRIDTLVQRVYQKNLTEQKMPGYRIQVYSGSVRKDAISIKQDLLSACPATRVYLIYKQPYFRVRVGDYRSRVDALKMFQALVTNPKYKGVLIVPDEINLPDL